MTTFTFHSLIVKKICLPLKIFFSVQFPLSNQHKYSGGVIFSQNNLPFLHYVRFVSLKHIKFLVYFFQRNVSTILMLNKLMPNTRFFLNFSLPSLFYVETHFVYAGSISQRTKFYAFQTQKHNFMNGTQSNEM